MKTEKTTYCGCVAIIGPPNVGKSTLLNQLLDKQISITSNKPQTTRHCIMGIHTEDVYQIIYLDTPGFQVNSKYVINSLMNRIASRSIKEADLIIFVVNGTVWTKDNDIALDNLRKNKIPIILAINKIDQIKKKNILLPYIKYISQKINFIDIVPISAITKKNIHVISNIVKQYLPHSKHHFPSNQVSNRSECFIASEIIREKLIHSLNAELPYSLTVNIEKFIKNDYGIYNIKSIIFVEKIGQKKIIIGSKGNKIRKVRIEAEYSLQRIFLSKIDLELWVKIKEGWRNNKYLLRNLGYIEDI
ncbi:GTPase Era [Candidatus Ishikawella capsulata]|uniref:GTPase Era n=1 Tax=Candidatus Ishikawaella capsulata Mpkobe TaxID=476281 RepID=C5WD97_9ENTR|nr:GTPase Era [Candidatus Ishikawaella capsulata]BAH83303.1 GTP-binding protein Era [Candidatus Ishikawaella capsulata Mpkobe]